MTFGVQVVEPVPGRTDLVNKPKGHPTIASLARHVGVDDGEISRILPLAFLAPDIVEAIVEGRQPVELTVRKLIRLKPLPSIWADQRVALGFHPS